MGMRLGQKQQQQQHQQQSLVVVGGYHSRAEAAVAHKSRWKSVHVVDLIRLDTWRLPDMSERQPNCCMVAIPHYGLLLLGGLTPSSSSFGAIQFLPLVELSLVARHASLEYHKRMIMACWTSIPATTTTTSINDDDDDEQEEEEESIMEDDDDDDDDDDDEEDA